MNATQNIQNKQSQVHLYKQLPYIKVQIKLNPLYNHRAIRKRDIPKFQIYSVQSADRIDTIQDPVSLKKYQIQENIADDPTIHNPLERFNRLSTNWMGVILELEGVCVEDNYELQTQTWKQMFQENQKSNPLLWQMKKIVGMKADQALSEVLVLTRDPVRVRNLATQFYDKFQENYLQAERKVLPIQGIQQFIKNLKNNKVPVAVVSNLREAFVKSQLKQAGLIDEIDVIISAEDIYRARPDPEGYLRAAQRMGRVAQRCIVVGNSNQSIEAAKDGGFKVLCIASAENPVYSLTSADLAIRNYDDLTFMNLKSLFSQEGGKDALPEEELEEVKQQNTKKVSVSHY